MAYRLVGIGVGPGDPELLTLAGQRELRCAGRVFVPVLGPDDRGRAEAVVRAHVADDTVIERLTFALADPVTGPQQRRRRHWDAAAERIVDYLLSTAGAEGGGAHGGTTHGGDAQGGTAQGETAQGGRVEGGTADGRVAEGGVAEGGVAAFATIGDPAVYSTFGYLAATVRALLPEVEIRTVPGITAMQAAASAAGITLVEGAEPLTVLPLTRNVTAVAEVIERGGTVVVYKGGRRLGELRDVITRSGALDRAMYAEHLGTPDARVLPLSEVDIAEPAYATGTAVSGTEAPGTAATGAEEHGTDERKTDERTVGSVDGTGRTVGDAPYLSTVVVLPPRGGRGAQL
ncbi:MAG TPA: precorrin-2 C(20)-methyltransferase [Pseudonocardiaceae bacterium]|jgi:precorrin-2/cobalt-factor-2 C20-methyltransferase|nr:precorrin-2 C(20)-methyltransferase [Pseudonocardiaceae bacterium]